MQGLTLIIIGAGLASLGFFIMIVVLQTARGDEVSRRLDEWVTELAGPAQKTSQADTVRRRELTGTFRTRVLQPWIKGIGAFFGRFMPARNIQQIDHMLAIAGHPMRLGAREFYGLRLVFALISAWAAYMALSRGTELANFLLAALAVYIGVFGPTLWLKRRVRHRQDRIRKDLPDALDMLSVCAQAGLGFDQSIQRVSAVWDSAFSTELGRLVGEMEMGVPRRQALRNMADRLDVTELSSFVTVIIQSDQLGMSIADTLQAQAKQMRIERRFRAQEAARKVPLKMLFPMTLLIFPAMLAVVCGPTIPLILDLFDTLSINR
jgi:tight adherence protein C